MTVPLHVVIAALGSHGDVHPPIALGRALTRRGHSVRLVSSPSFERAARAAGLEFEACCSEQDERDGIPNRDLWKRRRGFKVLFEKLLEAVPATYRIIAVRYVPGRTVVLANVAALGARIARERLGVPLVTLHLQPILLRSLSHQPGLVVSGKWTPAVRRLRALLLPAVDRFVLDPVVVPKLNAFRGTLDLPPVQRVFASWIHSPDLVLGLFPGWFAPPQPDWPPNTHLVGFPSIESHDSPHLAPELETFLAGGPPPIAFTAGTAMASAHQFFNESIESCRRSGRRGLVLTLHPEQLPSLPEGVLHVEYARFSHLLPRCAAVVHHGGIGTMAAAFAAGIPQIAVPFNFDQPDNAARLRGLGAGAVIRPRAYAADRVARSLDDLLASPTVLAKCRSIAETMQATPPAAAVCELVEKTAAAATAGVSPSLVS